MSCSYNPKCQERGPFMRTSRIRFLLAALSALALPLPGKGQEITSPYRYLEQAQEAGVSRGSTSVEPGLFEYGPDGGQVLGLRYGVELSGPLALEGVTQWIAGTRNVVDPGRVEGDRIIGQANAEVITIEARVRFSLMGRRSWHSLSPFLSFGGGIALNASGSDALDEVLLAEDRFDFGNSFYGTINAGSRWYLTQRFTVRGEGTFSLWKIDTPPGYTTPERDFTGVPDGEWLRGLGLSVALMYRW